jgi:hypothetical protein
VLVGATALARGHALATLNRCEFVGMKGFVLVPTGRFAAQPQRSDSLALRVMLQ